MTAQRDENSSEPAVFDRLGGGANQAGSRAYNERLTLSLIRRNGPLPKAELARLTGLSAQTLTTIARRLEAEGLVVAQDRLRGRVGQPSVPYALNPNGVLTFGLKIGRRSTDLVLCDFCGEILGRAKLTYAYPVPRQIFAFVRKQTTAMRKRCDAPERVVGVGVAMPFELWKWESEIDAPEGILGGWRNLDVADEVMRSTGLPTFLTNDATAACGAELARNERQTKPDFLYLFIGSFVGGGIVLNGNLFKGRTGNAGALGSMPVTVGGKTSQLIAYASLVTLERSLSRRGRDSSILQAPEQDWTAIESQLKPWIEIASEALAAAIISAMSVIDFSRVCIDGAVPPAIRDRIVARTQAHVARQNSSGLSPFDIVAGTIGADARVLGAAMLPVLANYTCDPEVLLKDLHEAPLRARFETSRNRVLQPMQAALAGASPLRK